MSETKIVTVKLSLREFELIYENHPVFRRLRWNKLPDFVVDVYYSREDTLLYYKLKWGNFFVSLGESAVYFISLKGIKYKIVIGGLSNMDMPFNYLLVPHVSEPFDYKEPSRLNFLEQYDSFVFNLLGNKSRINEFWEIVGEEERKIRSIFKSETSIVNQ